MGRKPSKARSNKKKGHHHPLRSKSSCKQDVNDGGAGAEGQTLLDPELAEALGGGGGELLIVKGKKDAAVDKKRKLDARGQLVEDEVRHNE